MLLFCILYIYLWYSGVRSEIFSHVCHSCIINSSAAIDAYRHVLTL